MALSDQTTQPLLLISPEEMLKISSDISIRFAPYAGAPLDEVSSVAVEAETEKLGLLFPCPSDAQLLHSNHNSCIGLTAKELQAISRDVGTWFQRDLALSALEPELLLLPVDPAHLYAYWHLGENGEPFEQFRPPLDDLTLRVYWRPDGNTVQTSSNVWFDVDVAGRSDRRKVPLPIDDSAYSASLGTIGHDNRFQALAHSNVIRVPAGTSKFTSPPQPKNGKQRDHSLPLDTAKDWHDATQRAKPFDSDTTSVLALTDVLLQGRETLQHLSDSGWRVRLHFRYSHGEEDSSLLSAAELFHLLDGHGVDVQLIPELAWIEPVAIRTDRKSGQGIQQTR